MALQVNTTSGFTQVVSNVPAITSVSASTSSQVLAVYDTDRVHLTIYNKSTANLYLAWGPTASATLFTVMVKPGGYYEIPPRAWVFAGTISGVWDAANGAAMVTVAT